MLERLLSRLRPGSGERDLEREAEHNEADRLKQQVIDDRAYVRFGPRNSVPNESYDDERRHLGRQGTSSD